VVIQRNCCDARAPLRRPKWPRRQIPANNETAAQFPTKPGSGWAVWTQGHPREHLPEKSRRTPKVCIDARLQNENGLHNRKPLIFLVLLTGIELVTY
jgi:hypothetical protein